MVDSSIVTENADSARIFGAELELAWAPVQDLLLVAYFGYLNGRFIRYVGRGFDEEDPEAVVDFSGNTMLREAEISSTSSAQYQLGLGRCGSLSPRMLIGSSLLGLPSIAAYDPPRLWGVRLGLSW